MKKLLNKRLVETLINLIKRGVITSAHINEELIDISNYNKYSFEELVKSNIVVSNKYIHYFVEEGFKLDKVVSSFLEEEPHCYILTSGSKFIPFSVTHHAAKALIQRFIYMYLIDDLKFELGYLEKIYKKYFNKVCDLLEEDTDQLGNNEIVHSLIKELMYKSKIHDLKNTGRIRDIKAFKRRNSIHKVTNRYFVHPFLFIIEDGILKTVELYSSSQDFRHHNAETKKKNFNSNLLKMLGRK